MIGKFFAYLMKCCADCAYSDVICKNQISQWVCIRYDIEVKSTDCCNDWKYRELKGD